MHRKLKTINFGHSRDIAGHFERIFHKLRINKLSKGRSCPRQRRQALTPIARPLIHEAKAHFEILAWVIEKAPQSAELLTSISVATKSYVIN